ncbi:N-acetylmuramoyl-L-alanine amidase [Streptomyces sp. NBC_01794]|uniref:peptidoglycan recognition protein family protein n=1 Tax=Streptomyces sp. NBC_01794 TaxID=2975942 RepID=UPI00308C86F7|nr:N-acetylmuramoyl-L-alanine amidase [Streptomyces sp. NBC_01794]
MAWYSAATRYELQPESDNQQAIRPTQFILHSIAAPWTAKRVYEYWRDSTNLESHFGLGYAGDLGQFIGTETRADANGPANLRPDGTGAVSLESASNLNATDPWTPEQVEQIIALGVWLHERHGIPLRICSTADDAGYGYHRLHSAWNPNGHSCPGDARVRQFRDVIFPGIVARATNTPPPEEDDMTPEQAKQLAAVAAQMNTVYGERRVAPWQYKGTDVTLDAYGYLRGTNADVKALASKVAGLKPELTPEQVQAIADKLAASPVLAESIAELVADKLAARLAD